MMQKLFLLVLCLFAVSPLNAAQTAVFVPPKINKKKCPAPKYPKWAIRRAQEGTVTVKLEVNDQGKIEACKLLQSSGHELLDQAVVTAVKKWQLHPAQKNNTHISSTKTIAFEFRLKGDRH